MSAAVLCVEATSTPAGGSGPMQAKAQTHLHARTVTHGSACLVPPARTCTHTHTHTHANTYTYTHTRTRTHTCKHLYIHTRACPPACARLQSNLDHSNRAYWPIQVVNRWLSVRLEMMGAFIVFVTTLCVAVLLPANPGISGLAITSALNLTG